MLKTLTVIAATAAVTVIFSLVLAFVINSKALWKGASMKKAGTRPLTFRISGIPRNVTKNEFRAILTNLTDEMSTTLPTGTADPLELLGWSFAPTAAAVHSGQSFVATATFHPPPAPSQLESAIKRKKGMEFGRLRIDLDFFGLTPLADLEEDPAVE
jgi:hypothetical protein